MDLDAVLARRPVVALVDKLAHTNVPGSRQARRFEDVLELVDAGIHVMTAVNIQHSETLNDTIARLTGVRIAGRLGSNWQILLHGSVIDRFLTDVPDTTVQVVPVRAWAARGMACGRRQ